MSTVLNNLEMFAALVYNVAGCSKFMEIIPVKPCGETETAYWKDERSGACSIFSQITEKVKGLLYSDFF